MPKGIKREDGKNAHTEASYRYNKKTYDNVIVRVKAGYKEKLQEYCAANDISVNKMIIDSVNQCTGINIK